MKDAKTKKSKRSSKVTFRTKDRRPHGYRDLETEDPASETFAAEEASQSRLQTQVNERLENQELSEQHHQGDEVLDELARKTGRVHRSRRTLRKGPILKLARVRPVALPVSEAFVLP